MKFRRVLQVTACLIIFGCALYILILPKRGEVIERWQTGNKTFNIRITMYNERPAIPGFGGAYYAFDSATIGSDRWKQILTFRHDAPVDLPRNQVRFVSDQVGYIFMGWMYAV